MGFNKTLKLLSFLFTILILLQHITSSTPSHDQEEEEGGYGVFVPSNAPRQYQLLNIKNTKKLQKKPLSSFLITKREQTNNPKKKTMKRKNSNNNMMMIKKREKSSKKHLNERAFSSMLPKGPVPPSDSSPCHNAEPDSYCGFSNPKP